MDFLKTPEMRLHEDAKIQDIIDELNSGERDDVAWAKALKSAKGNTSYAQALYIDERIKRLADFQHIIAADQKVKLLKYLEAELKDIDDVEASHSQILSVFVILGVPFAVFLFWEGAEELSVAVVIIIICSAIFSAVKLSRLDKQRIKISAELDKLSPAPTRPSWLGTLVVLAAVLFTIGYFLA